MSTCYKALIVNNDDTVSCCGKQSEPLMGFDFKPDQLGVRCTNHYATLHTEKFL